LHQPLNVIDLFGGVPGQDFAAGFGDYDVIFNADAELLFRDVNSRFNREDASGDDRALEAPDRLRKADPEEQRIE